MLFLMWSQKKWLYNLSNCRFFCRLNNNNNKFDLIEKNSFNLNFLFFKLLLITMIIQSFFDCYHFFLILWIFTRYIFFLQLLFNLCPIFDADFSHKQKKNEKNEIQNDQRSRWNNNRFVFFNEIHTYSFIRCH